MEFDTVIWEHIVLSDTTNYNSLIQTCKSINKKLMSNSILREKVVESYQKKLRMCIDLQLKRALEIERDEPITFIEPSDSVHDERYNVKFKGDEDWYDYIFVQCTSTNNAIDNINELLKKYVDLKNVATKSTYCQDYESDDSIDMIDNLIGTKRENPHKEQNVSFMHYTSIIMLGSMIPFICLMMFEAYSYLLGDLIGSYAKTGTVGGFSLFFLIVVNFITSASISCGLTCFL